MKKLAILAVVAMAMSSCSSIYVSVTDNPVGSKRGEVTGMDKATIGAAAKNGGITEIGTVKYQMKGNKTQIIVTGN